MNIELYGLLYIDKKASAKPTGSLKATLEKQHAIYLKCAALTAKSARSAGLRLRIVSNAKPYLEELCHRHDVDGIELVQHSFSWNVPPGIPFQSAHYKVELMEAVSSGRFGEFACLVDIDTVFISNPFSNDMLRKHLADGHLAVYDVTSQLCSPKISRAPHLSDIEQLLQHGCSNPRWFGGEFIAGSHYSFASLVARIQKLWPAYLEGLRNWEHVGDELPVSAAINELIKERHIVYDVGTDGLVVRWWSSTTPHVQDSLADISGSSLWHLPADKMFLASQAKYAFTEDGFKKAYFRYASRKLRIRRLLRFLINKERVIPSLY